MNLMVVAQNLEAQQAFASVLGASGLAPILATTVKEAETIVNSHFISPVFYFDEAPLGALGDRFWCAQPALSHVPVVVVSRSDDWERRRNALRAGALDYVLFPLVPEVVERALELWSR
jgi:DNA-binding response OmpR family regulator